VHPPYLLALPARLEPFAGKLVDGLQHHEARLTFWSFFLPQEALVKPT
jgi:hypothetical protein